MDDLYNRLCSRDVLQAAWLSIRRKNAAGGVDGLRPELMDDKAGRIINEILEELIHRRYVPLPYAAGAIPKFNARNEWRNLSKPAVRDKIVQQAYVDIVEPIFEKVFLDCSYAYRKRKGPIAAIRRVENFLGELRMKWVATLDIDDFFDSMNRDLLLSCIARHIEGPEMLDLARLWLDAGIVGGKGDWEQPEEGISQGSIVSPLFANIYLHKLDAFAVERKVAYVRYSDNFIVMAESRDRIYVAYEELVSFLERELHLKINPNPNPFKEVVSGFVFLGIYFKGERRRISTVKETKIYRKINWLTEVRYLHDIEVFIEKLHRSVSGTQRYYGHFNPKGQFEAFDRHLLKRLKHVMAHFHRKGLLAEKDQLAAFAMRATFYLNRLPDEKKKLSRSLAVDVLADTIVDSETKTSAANKKRSLSRRRTASASRYLRQAAGLSEMLVTSQGVFLGKTGNRIVAREARKTVAEIPLARLRSIAIESKGVSLSSDLVFECCKANISMVFALPTGIPFAVLQSPLHAQGDVSVLQLKTHETVRALNYAKGVVAGKSKNQMSLLKFYLRSRNNDGSEYSIRALQNIEKMEKTIAESEGIRLDGTYVVARDRLFTLEARISALYWDCMKLLVIPEMNFTKRERRKPPDIVNNMLNYSYGILYHKVWRALLKAGLNPHISFFHAFQRNKPTLVFDLVEEFRQPFADRAVFSLLTKGKKGLDMKLETETGLLDKKTRCRVVAAVQKRLAALVSHRGKKIKAEDIFDIQAGNYARKVSRVNSGYRPYLSGY